MIVWRRGGGRPHQFMLTDADYELITAAWYEILQFGIIFNDPFLMHINILIHRI